MGWIGYISIVGVGAAGTAGVSHTGGNLYEEMRPTVLKQQEQKGYTYVPVSSPGERKSSDGSKFTWASGGCFKRLFPGVAVQHNIPGKEVTEDVPSPKASLSNPQEAYKDYIGCTTMDMSPWGANNNQIYYKSETVIKNDKVGIAIGTGLSTVTGTSDKDTSTKFDLFYRLIFLQKSNEGKGEIKRGFSWVPIPLGGYGSTDKYFIKTPGDYGIDGIDHNELKDIEDKSGSGVWEPSKPEADKEIVGNHPGKDIEVHNVVYKEDGKASDDLEKVFGEDSPFEKPATGAGGHGLTVGYNPTSGGKNLTSPSSTYDATEELKSGYVPFKDQKGQWTELSSRCNAISSNRGAAIRFSQELMNLCFTSEKTESTTE